MPDRSSSLLQPAILKFWGLLSVFTGLAMIPAGLLAFIDGTRDWQGLVGTAAIAILTGHLMKTRGSRSADLRSQDAYLMVSGAWLLAILWGALVYIACDVFVSPVAAIFESTSGFTTTGSTAIADIEVLPRGILLWRSTTQWLGGMGIIVLAVAILPALGIGGLQLMDAEVPGLAVERLRPRLATTARLLWSVYALITLAQVLCLWRFGLGMSLFDAVNHAFTTMATGGFSTRNASMMAFSPLDQWITGCFIFLAGCNFTLHYRALAGRPLAYFHDEEFRLFARMIGILTLAVAALLVVDGRGLEPGLRHAFFQTVSLVTTTGFVSDNYDNWPALAIVLVWIKLFVGGCSGSTAGGIKQVRLLCLWKAGLREIRQYAHPRAVLLIKLNGRVLPTEAVLSVMGFVALYLFLYLGGAVLLALGGLDFVTALGSSAASISNVGPGLGTLGAVGNYASTNFAVQIVSSVLMLIGRLELMTILVAIALILRRRAN
jgi:trk system potassium uptake protein TrkH